MQNRFVIGSERQIRKYVSRLPAGAEWKWCYFGIDIGRKEKFKKILTSSKRYHYAKELYSLSRSLKQPFLDWMARINSQHQNDLKWWATRFASKSPFQTNFFLLFCYFNLIDAWLADQTSEDHQLLVIIIEDPYLHWLLGKRSSKYGDNKVQVKPFIFRVAFSDFYQWMKSRLVPFVFFSKQSFASLKNIYIKYKFRDRFRSFLKFRSEVMISTFIEERSFREDEFNDPYMRQLAELYEKIGKKVIISSRINLQLSLKIKALISSTNFFIPDFYLKTMNWIKVLFTRPPIRIAKEAMRFKGFDYAPLFERELNWERASLSFYYNLCEYYSYKNYFSRNKQLKLLVYPFENQPWEKMILTALKSVNPTCVCAGYQHTTMPLMLLNYFLGEDEYKVLPLPDYIIANSVCHEKLFATAGYKSSNIINGGSLRYEKGLYKRSDATNKRPIKVTNVLLLLTSIVPYCLEVIYSSREMLSISDDCRIYVKPHPDLFNKEIERAIKKIRGVEIIKSGSMEEVLSKMDAVVYTGTTAALEALYKGLFVYKVATEMIDLDVLEDLNFTKHYTLENDMVDSKVPYFCYDNKIAASFNDIIGEPVKKDIWLSLLKA